MALFGTAERSTLPLLTQFYQVDVPPYVEKRQHKQALNKWLESLRGSELFAFLSHTPGADFYGATPLPAQMAHYADLHKAVVALMNAFADNTEIEGYYVNYLQDWLNRNLTPQFLLYDLYDRKGGDEPIQNTESLPASDIRLHIYTPKSAILEELATLLKNPENKVKRCPECTSAYIIKRQGQIYCSERCSARVRERRRSQKSKDAEFTHAEK